MKSYTAFALFIAAISNLSGTEAFITDQVIEAIEEASQAIKDYGIDPLVIKREGGFYELPVPVIFNAGGYYEEVLSTGLSNIIINDIHYDVIGFRLTFDIEMPHIHISLGNAVGEAALFNNNLSGEASGSLDIYNARVKGDVRIGVLSGIGVRAVGIDSSIGAIDSNIRLNVQGYDLTEFVNYFVGDIVLERLEAYKSEVDELIGILLMDYINENLLN